MLTDTGILTDFWDATPAVLTRQGLMFPKEIAAFTFISITEDGGSSLL
jgi:hypothetical protein